MLLRAVNKSGLMLLAFWLWIAPAAAEPAPVVAPPAAWIQPAQIPASDPALAGKPLQMLLADAQSRYDETAEHYLELASKVQNSAGLQAMGNVSIPWQPDQADLIVHKVNIIRDGKVIDLLAAGQTFTVLRRENNLEGAMLNGVLTAVMQPEGLAVGDVIDLAFTIRRKPGALPLRGENLFMLIGDAVVRRLHYRQVWTDGSPMRWRATPAMGVPKVVKTRWGNEMLLELTDAKAPKIPDGAPARYQIPALLELSGYREWNDISRLMAPVYASARTIGEASPLRAEIARIAAATDDPAKRALAALRLVQERIRYLALAMGDGALVPATADQTWSRKFGDCKGKTATLLALLDGLGIEAEPVAISMVYGSNLNEHLPLVNLFNHVIVRAQVGGRSLWLDGTATDDRTLEDVSSYPTGFGLPIRAAGAGLEALPLLPPSAPMSEADVTLDASAGFDRDVPFKAILTYRGPLAVGWRAALAQDETEAHNMLKQGLPSVQKDDVETVTTASDEVANTFTATLSGKTRIAWTQVPSSQAIRVKLNDETIEWTPDFNREEEAGKDTPFALSFPVYLASRETIILPEHGAGFKVEATSFDKEVAGTRIARTVTLEGGKVVAVSTFRRLRNEISAQEAGAAAPALARINEDNAYLRSPDNYRLAGTGAATAGAASGTGDEPKTASEYIERGYRSMDDGRTAEALADFDRALALAPRSSQAQASRGMALVRSDRLAEAETALDLARQYGGGEEKDFAISLGYGLLHLARDKPAEAAQALTRSLALQPGNSSTLAARALAYTQTGQMADALRDMNRAVEINPANLGLLIFQARLAAANGNERAALAAADKVMATDDQSLTGLLLKAQIYRRFGRKAEESERYSEALALLDRQIAASGNDEHKAEMQRERVSILVDAGRTADAMVQAGANLGARPNDALDLNNRCWHRVLANVELEGALEDCERAVRINPKSAAEIDSRAWVQLRLGHPDLAIADFDRALAISPRQSASLYGRGLAKLRKGDKEGGERDLARARRFDFDVDFRFKQYGLMP